MITVMGSPPGTAYDPVIRGRRYVLGETDDFFGIWERGATGEPIDRFPLTAEGFEEAKARLKELRREARGGGPRRDLSRPLLVALAIGVAAWVLGGILTSLSLFGPIGRSAFWNEIGFVAGAAGFPLTIGSLALLIGVGMARLVRREPGATVVAPGWPGGRLASTLAWLVAGGLVVWIVASVAARLLEPVGGILSTTEYGGIFDEDTPATGYRVSQAVAAIASYVWVAAAVGFALLWIRGDRETPTA